MKRRFENRDEQTIISLPRNGLPLEPFVRKTAHGLWRLHWVEPTPTSDGKVRNQKYTEDLRGYLSVSGAKEAAVEFLRKFSSSYYSPPGTMTIRQYVWERFDRDPEARAGKPWGRYYDEDYARTIVQGIGTITLKELPKKPYSLCRFFESLREHHTPGGIRIIASIVSAVIEHATASGMFTGDNPMARVELPPRGRRRLTREQTQYVIENLNEPNKTMALFVVETGLKIEEVCALRWKYVNLGAEPITVAGDEIPPQSVAVREKFKRGVWSAAARSDAGRTRIRQLSDDVAERLRRRLMKTNAGPDDVVFPRQHLGGPIPDHMRNAALRRIGKLLKVPRLSWDMLEKQAPKT